MHHKIYHLNDRKLTESMMLAGLSEYKAREIIFFANENKISIQKAYWLTEANIIRLDMIMLLIMLFFSFSIAQESFSNVLVFF